MSGKIESRQFTLKDRDALLAFLGRVYAADPRRSDREFWEWHYLKNPYSDTNDLPIWIALDGERIVGHLAAIETEVKIGDEVHPTIWILDLIIDENYRRRGIAKRLVEFAEELPHTSRYKYTRTEITGATRGSRLEDRYVDPALYTRSVSGQRVLFRFVAAVDSAENGELALFVSPANLREVSRKDRRDPTDRAV